jgi:hypothetical protein
VLGRSDEWGGAVLPFLQAVKCQEAAHLDLFYAALAFRLVVSPFLPKA